MNIFDFYWFQAKQDKNYLKYGMDFCKYHEYKHILKFIKIKKKDILLDIGCSDSFLSWYIASLKKTTIYLADINQQRLQVQKERIKNFSKNITSRINIIQANITYLPFPNNYFDVIFAIQLFSLLPVNEDIKGIKEIFRVLKPNSYAILTLCFGNSYIPYEKSSSCNFWGLKQRIYNLSSIHSRLLIDSNFKNEKMIFFGDRKITNISNFWNKYIPKKYLGWCQPLFSEICELIDTKNPKDAGNLILFLKK